MIPWTAPMTFIAGTPLPASDLNTHLRDNTLALRAGGIAMTNQTADDFVTTSSSTQFSRMGSADTKLWFEVFCG